MNIKEWKLAATTNLRNLAGIIHEFTPGVLYGVLSTSILLPVVTAANQGDFSALIALTSVVSSVGGNLIANEIQAWKERNEKDLAAELSEKAESSSEWRSVLDKLINEFEAPQIVQAILSEADKDWFISQLRSYLSKIGSSVTYDIVLSGSGAIVQGHSVGGGERSIVVGKSIQDGIFSTGDNPNITYILNQYTSQTSPVVDVELLRSQIINYLKWVADRYGTIEFRGIKREGQQVIQLDLGSVYVPLEAKAYGTEVRAIELDQLLILGNRIVVTGGPGSGKTTVLLNIASTLASAIIVNKPAIAKYKLGIRDQVIEQLKELLPEILDNLHSAINDLDYLVQHPNFPNEFEATVGSIFKLAEVRFGLKHDIYLILLDIIKIIEDTRQQDIAWLGSSSNEQIESKLKEANKVLQIEQDLIPIPILIPISAYSIYRQSLSTSTEAHTRTLASFISRYLIEKQTSFDLPENFFSQLMRSGTAIILLLDGLDEVPKESSRVQVRQAIEELAIGKNQIRIIVTCRTAAYEGRTTLGRNFKTVSIKELDDKHIESLVRRAYAHIYHNDVNRRDTKSIELLQGITKLESERRRRIGSEINRLVSNPLMVRMLLIVHFSERRLPEHRAELYMKATDAILLPDYAPDEEIADQIGRLIGNSKETHREILQLLAFRMHSKGMQFSREILEDELRRILYEEKFDVDLVNDFIALTRLRGTLLEEQTGSYRFIHLAFQEYLVARYLAEVIRDVNQIVSLLTSEYINDSWWREPILLLVGYLSVTSPSTAKNFISRLGGIYDNSIDNRLDDETKIASIELATTALLEWQPERTELFSSLMNKLISFLDSGYRPKIRVLAGNSMARIGDPRFSPVAWNLPEDHLLGFIEIPEGAFILGTKRRQYEMKISLFYMSRYHVTVSQFQKFVDATGYKFTQPIAPIFGNHPQTDVSWIDAMAYCHWLTCMLREWKDTPETLATLLREEDEQGFVWQISLPSTAQWEKAARGIDGRNYSWGEQMDFNKANYLETKIGTTSPIGCFSNGTSPFGVEDMCGNVWEWTSTQAYSEEYEAYYLKGGSFQTEICSGKCDNESWLASDGKFKDVGFRLVLSMYNRSK